MVASDEAAAAASYAEGQWAGVVGEHDRAVLGCLHSVLAVLEELGGVPRETLPAEWYMSRRSDPHAALAALLPPVDEASLAVVAQAVAPACRPPLAHPRRAWLRESGRP